MKRGGGSVVLVILCVVASGADAAGPSLCLAPQPGCLTPGGIQVRVRIGAGDEEIVGGQFIVRYDPQVLRLIDAAPGRTCDPSSPFSLKVAATNDPETGELFAAVGVNFVKDGSGSLGPATLACLSFSPAVGSAESTELCLIDQSGVALTLLVDGEGQAVHVDNSVDCPAEGGGPTLACASLEVYTHCTCVPDTLDCHGLDTDCRVGFCNPATRLCEVSSINEGGACDDQDACTPVAHCAGGVCIGEGCTTSSLCMYSGSCLGLDPVLNVVVKLTPGQRLIGGAQFSMRYDSAELELVEILPGSACDPGSPFSTPLSEIVDEAAGAVFYAVGVAIGGPQGTTGPAALACLRFNDLGEPGGSVCTFQDSNPFTTILVDQFGQAVPPGGAQVCPVVDGNPPAACAGFETCAVPTLSHWGLAALTLLLLIGAKIAFTRRTPA